MHWLIQNTGVTFACLDNNVEPLVHAIDEYGHSRQAVGVIPFTDDVVGMEDADSSIRTCFYGSTRLVELAAKMPFYPAVFFKKEWFDPYSWRGKRSDLLNEAQTQITADELRTEWTNGPIFIKSADPKVLTGMVLEGDDKDWWMIEYDHIKADERLIVSPIQKIVREWRFFLVDGNVVSGSQYKHDGVLRIREPIPDNVWMHAHRMALEWLPHPTIVMDIAEMDDGQMKVVEFNCLNCSGFYAAPIIPILGALDTWV